MLELAFSPLTLLTVGEIFTDLLLFRGAKVTKMWCLQKPCDVLIGVQNIYFTNVSYFDQKNEYL